MRFVLLTLIVAIVQIVQGGICSAQTSAGPLRESDGVSIPFKYDRYLCQVIVISIRVNGHPVNVFVETGSSDTVVLDEPVAKRLNLPAEGEPRKGSNGSRLVTSTTIRRLEYFGRESDDVEAAFTDLSDVRNLPGSPKIDGFVGLAVLKLFTIRLDFVHNKMTVFYKPHAPYHPAGSAMLPMNPGRRRYWVPMSADGAKVLAMVDTGSNGTDFPDSLASALRPLATTKERFTNVAGEHVATHVLLPSVALGSLRARKVAINLVPPEIRAKLGTDLMFRFRVTLDFRNQLLTLERPAEYEEQSRLFGYSGIELASESKNWIVKQIYSNSPAFRTELQVDDVVVKVDGVPLVGRSYDECYALLTGFEGTQARVTVMRPGKGIRTIKYVRSSEFARNKH